MTAEAGRALQQFKMAARSKDHRRRVLQSFIENGGGKDNLENIADAIVDLERDPAALNRFLVDANKPTWKDKLVELWYNSLLSGPQTHAVNTISNFATQLLQVPEHAAAALVGQLRRRSTDSVLMSEVGPRAVGLLHGAREGLSAFRNTLLTGDVPDFVTKVESARQEAISGGKGKIIRMPTRLLSAEDEFFKATARRMELAGLAVRKARSEGLKGEGLTKRIEELNANPTDDMVEKELDYGRYLTFQRPLGPKASKVMQLTTAAPILKLVMPFVRTPTNLLKYAVERSPFAPLLKEVRDDFKAGGARRDLALAKMALGSAFGFTMVSASSARTIPHPTARASATYIHIADLVTAHLLALDGLRERDSLIYNLGSGNGYSVREVIETARQVTGNSIPSIERPPRPGDSARLVAASDKITRELGWLPRHDDLREIISSAWEWHKSHPHGYEEKSS